MIEYIYVFISGFLLTTILTLLALRYSQNNLLDKPNKRSSHNISTPTGGGISMVLVSLVGLLILYHLELIALINWIPLLLSALVLSLVSYYDDHLSISVKVRIVVHIICSVVILIFFTKFPSINVGFIQIDSEVLRFLFGILLITWLLNLFNFMDGTDGLVSVEALFTHFSILLFIFFVSFEEKVTSLRLFNEYLLLSLLLISSILGFLIWNWPKAKIFMGDVGSSFLGLFTAALGIFVVNLGWINIWTFLILLGAFISDSTVTLIVRIFTKQKWHAAHNSHTYQKIAYALESIYKKDKDLSRTLSHRYLCYLLTLLNILWLAPLALLSLFFEEKGLFILVIAYAPLLYISYKYKAGIPVNKVSQ